MAEERLLASSGVRQKNSSSEDSLLCRVEVVEKWKEEFWPFGRCLFEELA